MEAYCVRCKAKQEMVNPTIVRTKNGKPAMTGTCAACGTRMFRIGEPASVGAEKRNAA